ncbi:uncharacterized protein TRUGW13939_06310 [Talaromyces rugulosus]|uniref:Zn(2)-C6 fungal-type domain-containing protein n=1 Tax=Talaromyces rugulosus TaxID=121627 RepID=A0A7H8QZR7_TALRU|nr:uncharacterized protein TRUGW13939_06310 [Talaromyces rugulosus]QKX59178.1 hypothetical protein TRUGW13939_06310 [Talaromyces rugulosus]
MPNVGRPSPNCHSCRRRRIKCDLIRPECTQCIRLKQPCPGYRDELEIRFRREDPSTFQSYKVKERRRPNSQKDSNKGRIITREKPPSHKLLYAPEPSLFPGNVQETQYFQFFRTVTASNLAGVFDFGFWTCDTLQASHLYPALWHATAALGAVHVQLNIDGPSPHRLPTETGYHDLFAFKQCSKSIQSLTKLTAQRELSEQDRTVILTTCILFSHLSALQGYQEQAFMHIHNGLKLIRDWRLEEMYLQRRGHHTTSMLILIFNQLDSQGRYIRQGLKINATSEKPDKLPPTIPFSVERFTSCLQAYVELERLINRFSHLGPMTEDESGEDAEQTIVRWKQVYSQALAAWDTRFSHFLATTSEQLSEKMIILLRIRCLFTSTLFEDPRKGELGYDEFVPQFATIVDLVGRILEPKGGAVTVQKEEGSVSPQNTIHQHADISLSVIISEPLIFTAMRCREPNTRHRALDLLKKYPRREGVVNSILATKLLGAFISFEEKSCPKYTSDPDSDRSTASVTCSTGRWICSKHRVGFREFLHMSSLGEQNMQKWKK